MSQMVTDIEVAPLSRYVSAEISGVDLTELCDDEFAQLRAQLAQWGVIFFREQPLTPEQHIAFAQRWSTINVNRFFGRVLGRALSSRPPTPYALNSVRRLFSVA